MKDHATWGRHWESGIVRLILSVITLLVLLAGIARAEESGSSQPMTWEMCVREAAEKNPDLAAAAAAVKSAEAQSSGAYSNYFPQLSATGTFTESNGSSGTTTTSGGSTTTLTPLGPSGGAQSQFSAGLTATQSVFNGFKDQGTIRQTKASLEAARAALAIQKASLSASLRAAFAELLYEQENQSLAQAILKREQASLRLVTLRFEGGRENKGNQLYQGALVTQARYQVEHAIRSSRAAAKQLAALLGRPETEALVVSGMLKASLPSRPDFRALARSHPSRAQAYYQRVAAQAGIDIANSGWYPQLSLNGFVGRTGPSFFPENNHWSAGATLAIPLFQGGATRYAEESARAQEMQAEYNEQGTENKILAGLEQAYAAFEDAQQMVSVAEEFTNAAKSRSTISTEKYNTGLMTFEDWSVIQSDLVNREQTLLQNQRNAVQAQATWENAEGVGAIP